MRRWTIGELPMVLFFYPQISVIIGENCQRDLHIFICIGLGNLL